MCTFGLMCVFVYVVGCVGGCVGGCGYVWMGVGVYVWLQVDSQSDGSGC